MAEFIAASSKRIWQSTPITAVPFTVGFWVRPTIVSVAQDLFSITDTAGTADYFSVEKSAANTWGIGCNGIFSNVGTVTQDKWSYLICRYISATNRRLAVLNPDGSTSHVQSTTSRTPAGVDTMTIGAFEDSGGPQSWSDAHIAEWWIADIDIQADAAQLQDPHLRNLAYYGPFWYPHIARNIVEYRRLGQSIGSDTDKTGEAIYGKLGKSNWTNVNNVLPGLQPPVMPMYERPGQYTRLMLV
jgi:hypothetical protein